MSEEEILETLTKYNLVNHFNNTKFFEALNGLLIMYNQEKKNKRIKDCTLIVGRRNGKSQELNVILEEYISKDKIRAKIEELNKTIYNGKIPEFYAIYRYTADVLEELLEE